MTTAIHRSIDGRDIGFGPGGCLVIQDPKTGLAYQVTPQVANQTADLTSTIVELNLLHGATFTAAQLNAVANPGAARIVNITAAGAITKAANANAGIVNTINAAAGIALTLPAATGSGDVYEFFVGTTITSLSTTITAAGSDKLAGNFSQTGATGAATNFGNAGTATTLTLNGTTKGGFKGDVFSFKDVGAALWSVNGRTAISGTAATPLS